MLDAKRLIETNAFDGWRKVIDFSGDSPNNFNPWRIMLLLLIFNNTC